MTVSQWADTFRQLPSVSAEPGRWKTSRVPYFKEVMDAFTQAGVHRVVVKSAAQVGKSEVLLNVIGRFAMLDPATVMIVQPTLEMAQDFSKDRLERMIRDTKVLTPLFYDLGKTRTANQTILSKFYTGGRIVLQGANSPAGLASRPIRILLCDEVDRFPQSAQNEGDPVDLAAKRQSSFWNYKTGLFSTPTVEGESRIDIEYKLGTQEQWSHACPNCGEYHFLDYREMVSDYDEHVEEKSKVIVVNSVKWRCPNCGMDFSEQEMRNTPQKYIVQNPDAIKNEIRSFWVNGFSSPWQSWRSIMTEWLTARGNPTREAVVYNTRFGTSYKLTGEYKDENAFLERREEYAAELPREVLLLTAGVDVQANRLEYEIVGWGVDEECYGIKRGLIRGTPNEAATWLELDSILDREYKFGNGESMKVARSFIDSGYATKTVYAYCHSRREVGRFAIKGSGAMGIPLLYKYTYPRGYNIILTILGVNDGKQEIMSRLGITKAGAQYFHFPKDDDYIGRRGYDEIYFKQLIAEKRVVRRSGGLIHVAWEPVHAHARNESLDCRVYAYAAMKSCIGSDKDFWKKQRRELKLEVKRPATREIDIWN